jgi:tRNA threonylcarbamoyladenosine biosynthesis protein TsaB
MIYILNIESATSICSVCISQNGKLISIHEADDNKHASEITLMIDKCLIDAGLKMTGISAVAISNGPGSYTSLRVGASTAKGICYALNIPMIAVDTLQSLAMASYLEVRDETAFYCPMIDARRMEVYSAIYKIEDGNMINVEPMSPIIVDEQTFKRFLDMGKRLVFSGNAVTKCRTVIVSPMAVFSDNICSSRNMIPLSTEQFEKRNFVDVAYHTPLYLKAPNITKAKKIF